MLWLGLRNIKTTEHTEKDSSVFPSAVGSSDKSGKSVLSADRQKPAYTEDKLSESVKVLLGLDGAKLN